MPVYKTHGRWKVKNVKYPVEGFKTKKEAAKQLAAVKIWKDKTFARLH